MKLPMYAATAIESHRSGLRMGCSFDGGAARFGGRLVTFNSKANGLAILADDDNAVNQPAVTARKVERLV